MKKLTVFLFALLTVCFPLADRAIERDKNIIAYAEEIPTAKVGNMSFEVWDENTVVLTEYTGKESTVIIPETIEAIDPQTEKLKKYNVSVIDAEVFKGNKHIKKVVLPEGIYDIGEEAFMDSTLEEINIPPDMNCIKTRTFCNSNIKSVSCENLYSIYDDAFKGCKNLEKADFPNLIYLNCSAFSGTKVNIKELLNPDMTLEYDNITYYVLSDTELELKKFNYKGTPVDVVIPDNLFGRYITKISAYAFAGNDCIKKVTLPDSMTEIEIYAFANSSVESINIPKNVKHILTETFARCPQLKNVEWHDDMEYIDDTAFMDSEYQPPDDVIKVKDINIDGWETKVQYDNYEKKYSICLISYNGSDKEVTIPYGYVNGYKISEIKEDALLEKRPESVIFPESCNNANLSIINYPELKKVRFLAENVTLVGKCENAAIEELDLPVKGMRDFYNYIYDDNSNIIGINYTTGFINCKKLKKVNFSGSGILEILPCFHGCTNLRTITFSDDYTFIKLNNPFTDSAIEELEINQSCIVYSLNNLKSLKKITFKDDAKITKGAFEGCENLTELGFYKNLDAELNTFMDCPVKNIIISADTKFKSGRAFNNCQSLVNINSEPAFDNSTGDFNKKYKDFIFKNFNDAEDIAFLNTWIKTQCKKIVKECITEKMSDIEKVKALHDWVCNNTAYDDIEENIFAPKNLNDASVLLNDKSVCVGYSKICNLLYHEAGIETYLVESPSHAWNIVKLGGHYFHVDSTWDDGEKIS